MNAELPIIVLDQHQEILLDWAEEGIKNSDRCWSRSWRELKMSAAKWHGGWKGDPSYEVVRGAVHDMVKKWRTGKEREREKEKCWCFLNSLRGTPNPLSSRNQLTNCHLPAVDGVGGGGRAYNSPDWHIHHAETRALSMLAQENPIPSKHRPPSAPMQDGGHWHAQREWEQAQKG